MFIHTYDLKKDVDGCGGGPWHVAAFTNPKNYYEIAEWCHKTFGEPGYHDKPTRWKDDIYYGEISFRNKEDLEWFMLRWL
jgi:hypothetical protein